MNVAELAHESMAWRAFQGPVLAKRIAHRASHLPEGVPNMELKQYVAIVWKWLWLIILGTSVAAVSTYMASKRMPPIYRATATVLIGSSVREADPNTQDLYTSQRLADTYREMVRRRPLRMAAANALGLSFIPEADASTVGSSQLMDILVEDTSPERAASIANEIVHQLILQSPTTPEKRQEELRLFVEGQVKDLQENIENTQSEIAKVQKALDAETSAWEIANRQQQLVALQQKLNSYQTTLGPLLASIQDSNPNYIEVFEYASIPASPIGPNTTRNVMLATAVGMALAVATAFLLEYLDDTIKTPEDAERAMGTIPLGAINQIEGLAQNPDAIVTARNPKSPGAEAYRMLRTNLQFTSVGTPASSFVITSSSAGEGKSTTLANLGVAIAQAGKRVILVDTDLRRPSLHKFFGMTNAVGLTTMLLAEELHVEDFLSQSEWPNLRLLASGPRPPNPAELLNQNRMDEIIAQLQEVADVVLFDSPPVLAVADATILAAKLQGVVLVVDTGHTRREICQRAVEALRQVDARILGVVLNKMTRARSGYYYYYYDQEDGTGDRRRRHRKRGILRNLSLTRLFRRETR